MRFLSISFLCFFITFNVKSIEYIQKYYTYKYINESGLINELISRKCTKIPLQLELIKKRYPRLKKNQIIKLQTCHQELSFSDDELGIIDWIEYIPPHNFILSNYLYDEKCQKIYTRQIPQFNKKNKLIYDPNIIFKNQKIYLQKCHYSDLNNPALISKADNINYENEDFYFKKENKMKILMLDKELEGNIQKYDKIMLYGIRYTNDIFLGDFTLAPSQASLKIDKFIGKGSFKPLIFIGYKNINKLNEPIIYGIGFRYKLSLFDFRSELQIKKTYPYTLEISRDFGTYFKSSIYRNVNGIGVGLSIYFN